MMQTFGTRHVEIGGRTGWTKQVSEGNMELVRDTLKAIAEIRAQYPDSVPRDVLGKIRRMAIESMVVFPNGAPDDAHFSGKDYSESIETDLYAFFLTHTMKM
jgi:hypothetical protein